MNGMLKKLIGNDVKGERNIYPMVFVCSVVQGYYEKNEKHFDVAWRCMQNELENGCPLRNANDIPDGRAILPNSFSISNS